MRLYMPIALMVIFALYLLYLAVIKKNLKNNLSAIVYPGLLFVLVWGICYFTFFQ